MWRVFQPLPKGDALSILYLRSVSLVMICIQAPISEPTRAVRFIFQAILVSVLPFSTLEIRADQEAAEAPSPIVDTIQSALQKANPDYRGDGKFVVRDGKLTAINLMRCKGIHDLSPLRNFPLQSVSNVSLYNAVNIADLSPLQACRIKQLNTERCAKLTDLSPLKGMPITWFRMYACTGVKDLSPLKGMPLHHLDIGLNPLIDDLSALEGMQLTDLRVDNCPKLRDLSVLRGMPLKFLSVFGCDGVKDFSPILELPLQTLYLSPDLLSREERQAVREMKSLKVLGSSWDDYGKKLTPAQFWERHDHDQSK